MIKAIKRLITITSPFVVGWMWYCFFNPELLTPEMLIGFIVYTFVILPWWAGDSAESYDWEDERDSFIYRLHNDPMFMDEVENIHYTPNND